MDITSHDHQITVEVKTFYGTEYVYPVCGKAKVLSSLTNTKTFTPQAIAFIKELGYTINVKESRKKVL